MDIQITKSQLRLLCGGLIGLASLVMQACDMEQDKDVRESICGNWESVESKPDLLIYKEGNAYKVTVFKRSGISRKLKPETYLLQMEDNGNLFMNTGFRIDVAYNEETDILTFSPNGDYIRATPAADNAGRASAQWAVIDPSNIAQSIINTSKNVAHTSTTATNMVKNFQETVKIYEQGKKYYDALKSVNNLVKDARKVQQTILMVGDITDIYVNSFQKMMRDENFTVEELGAIAFGYTKLLEESNDVLTELKNVVNITTLSMTDKERMDVVERCYSKMRRYRNLVGYYTNKNISVSYLRAKKKNDLDRVLGLYGNANERYW